MGPRSLARVLTDVLNPFVIFTALFFAVALAQSAVPSALLYAGVELLAAAAVAGFVVYVRRARVGDFWISARAERLTPAVFLLSAFVALLVALFLLGAPTDLFLLTLSMGLASATVALLTLFFKASAHCTVAGHAATAGVLVLGPLGWIFALGLPLVIWSRVTLGAHTIPETLAGALVGAGFALLLLL
jgi:hypothetical protein